MSRGLTAAMVAAMAAGLQRPIFFVELETAGGVHRFHNRMGERTWNSQTWQGVGSLLGFSAASESNGITAHGFVLSLSGALKNSTTQLDLGEALTDIRANKPVTVWLGELDAAGAVIAAPAVIFGGIVSMSQIVSGGLRVGVQIHCESRLVVLQQANGSLLTPQEQERLFPGDKGLEFVPKLPGQTIIWGQGATSLPSGSSGSSDHGSRRGPRDS